VRLPPREAGGLARRIADFESVIKGEAPGGLMCVLAAGPFLSSPLRGLERAPFRKDESPGGLTGRPTETRGTTLLRLPMAGAALIVP
jgi:hypothetical protein